MWCVLIPPRTREIDGDLVTEPARVIPKAAEEDAIEAVHRLRLEMNRAMFIMDIPNWLFASLKDEVRER